MPLGIDQLTATPQTIELGGRPYRLSPLTLADMGELQAWIHAQLPDPVALARRLAEGMAPEVQERILNRAFDHEMAARKTHMLGTEEADLMLATLPGFVRVLALMCRAHHPEATPDVLAPLVGGLDKDQINRIVLHAFGITPAPGDLAGQGPGAGDPKGPGGAGAGAVPPTTRPSSSTSPADMAMPPTSSAV